MAHMLDISQAAYTKIERQQTKLSVERLYKIAEILEVEVAEILEIKTTNQLNQTNKDNATGYLQQIENFFNENKDQYEKIIAHYDKSLEQKDNLIASLNTQLEKYIG